MVAASDIGIIDVITIALAVSAFVLSLVTVVLPWARRPKLSILVDRHHSHVEKEGAVRIPYLRVPVRNRRWTRSAKRARVVLDGYGLVGDDAVTRLGSPVLAWPSTFGQESDAYVDVLFSGSERPVGIGRFYPAVKIGDSVERDSSAPDATWWLHLELPGSYFINEQRDWLPPGEWKLRLTVGADEGDARRYALTIGWRDGHSVSAEDVLREVKAGMRVKRLRRDRPRWWVGARKIASKVIGVR